MASLIDSVPVWVVFPGTLVLVLCATWLGNLFGRRTAARVADDAPVSAVTAAHLSLLAFFLAFSFNMASGHFDARRKLVLEEVNAISGAYFAAYLLSDPARSETIRGLLREYVEIRASITPETDLAAAVVQAEAIQQRIRHEILSLNRDSSLQSVDMHFLRTVARVFDYHKRRVAAALHFRIPESIWPTLYCVLLFSMIGLGYTFGLKGSRNQLGSLALALSFSLVIYLTADLDRPASGVFVADQSAYAGLSRLLASEF